MSNVPHPGSAPQYANPEQIAAMEQQQLVAEQQQQFALQQQQHAAYAQHPQAPYAQQPQAPQPQAPYAQQPPQQLAPSPPKGVEHVSFNVAVPFAWDSSNQHLTAVAPLLQPLIAATNRDPGDQVVIEKIEAIKSTSTVPGDMVLRLYGVEGDKSNLTGKGYDLDGNGYTLLVPAGGSAKQTHVFSGKDADVYTRKANEHSQIDFADNINVNVDELEKGVETYYGDNGRLKGTHVEVLRNRNPNLYSMVESSKGLTTTSRTGTADNPGIALSKTEHKSLVDQWKKSGGFSRTSRINFKHHTATLSHFGVADAERMHDEIANLPGQTAASKAANAGISKHRVTVELKYTVAVPTKKKDKQ